MLLREVVDGLDATIKGTTDIDIKGIAYDSRLVKKGYLFVAIVGFKTDGHEFVQQAIEKGAAAVLVNKPIATGQVTVIEVAHSRQALAKVAANYYHHPSRQLKLFGITGTNGKTTTCHLTAAIFNEMGYRVGILGTIGNWIDNKKLETGRTTPESLDLQQLLRDMVEAGVTHVVMEVSSHALELCRVDEVFFRGAVFTNLSQDHLDFHSSLTDYLQAKGKLFQQLSREVANSYGIANADDDSLEYLQSVTEVPLITCGQAARAQVRVENISLDLRGVKFSIKHGQDTFELSLRMPGLFSVYNATAAAAVALQEGVPPHVIIKALERVKGVSGRFEQVEAGQNYTVIVDYAHTPDSLENVLQAARQFVSNRLITVFGCGGDRDRSKRPLMGTVAGKLSDYTIVTSDNPRSEEPVAIIEDILAGIKQCTADYKVVINRRDAIAYALDYAKEGDTVIIAGKGHETYQEIKGKTFDFDDKAVVRELLRG